MGKSLTEIAQQLKKANKKVQLIYAFNGMGKTRLSRDFKHLIAPKLNGNDDAVQDTLPRTKIIYFNAFTEDLFYWDNDLTHDVEPILQIQDNFFTKWVLKDQGKEQNVVDHFQHYTNAKLTPLFNTDYSEVRFTFERGNDVQEQNIKISKGEESNFIWSVFYSLIEGVVAELNIAEVDDRSTHEFNELEYVFIDDPVSSLDENHLIELAVDLAQLIKSSTSKELKFIVATHNPLFYNVLYNEVGAKSGGILRRHDDGTFDLEEKKGDSNKSFSYHLFLKHTLEQAIEHNLIQKYHFTLLRNLYEKTAVFLGYPQWSELLPDDKQAYLNRIIQFTSHSTLSNEAVAEPTEPEKQTVKFLLNHLVSNYHFWQQAQTHDDRN